MKGRTDDFLARVKAYVTAVFLGSGHAIEPKRLNRLSSNFGRARIYKYLQKLVLNNRKFLINIRKNCVRFFR